MRNSTTRLVFQEITLRRTVKTFCFECGAKLRRSLSTTKTVNPWNVTASGLPKTPDEVYTSVALDLDKKCRALEQKGTRCRKHP